MKTNLFLLFTTVLLCSGASLTANDNLCGGADDDQLCGGADDDQLCGGADDDQIFLPLDRGITSDPLGVVAGPAGSAQPPVLQGITSDPLGYRPPVPHGLVSDPLGFRPPVLQGLVSDPIGIAAPPNNIMALWTALVSPAPVVISGGNGNDSFKPAPFTDAMMLHIMATGSPTGDTMDDDDLWGGGGTDEIVGGDGADF
ncbi:hypothetical protein [Prosthecobacter sp.]|uniref:hypothetical protein n=1 Tax=Prosthecobacter sp. TaxID=1965333 RepID=UPI002ABBE75A|nr:hypothetical protein [Prosthecobacter sp.]MDZ4401466.1 hypothetical protein [Prosthecobacter sp.]